MLLILLLQTPWNMEMQLTDLNQFAFPHICFFLALGHLTQIFSFCNLRDVADLDT